MVKRTSLVASAIVLLTVAISLAYTEQRDQEKKEGGVFKREGLAIHFRIPSEFRAIYPRKHRQPWGPLEFGSIIKLTTLPDRGINLRDMEYCTINIGANKEQIVSLTDWLQRERPANYNESDKNIEVSGAQAVLRERKMRRPDTAYAMIFIPYKAMFYKIHFTAKGSDSVREQCKRHLSALIKSIYFEE